MKVLIHDPNEVGLAFAMRCQDAGHIVRLWTAPQHDGSQLPLGRGIVDRPKDWIPSMKWADIIVQTDNSKYRSEFKPFFTQGYPIFGANDAGAELELDREVGQRVFEECGIDTLPYEVFNDFDKAIAYIKKNKKPYVCKPWGGTVDKALTHVGHREDGEDLIFCLERWKKEGKLKGHFMLQEKADGIEMGVSCWFGPGGWSRWKNENWEEKKLMNDNLGCNTGEQGTTMAYMKKSALFDRVLKPLTGYLEETKYVGDVDINCIIDKEGVTWPLEFTCRLGWPAFNIMTYMHNGDPVDWMRDLIDGKDTLKAIEGVVVGVMLTHGKFPYSDTPVEECCGFPIYGLTAANREQIDFQSVMVGKAPMSTNGQVKDQMCYVTAGNYVLGVNGAGSTVREAQKACYDVAWEIDFPSNKMMRTDIGNRLKKELPKLHELGYAMEVNW